MQYKKKLIPRFSSYPRSGKEECDFVKVKSTNNVNEQFFFKKCKQKRGKAKKRCIKKHKLCKIKHTGH